MKGKGRSIAGQLIRCILAPLRGLCLVRNYYVRGMTSFAACFPSTEAVGCYRFGSEGELSFGRAKLSSGEEDLRELISFASRELESAVGEAVGRIGKGGSCDFSDVIEVGESLNAPGSQRCTVGRKRPSVIVPA